MKTSQMVTRVGLDDRFPRVPTNTVLAAERLLDVVATRHGHAAFIARALNALATLAEQSDERTMVEATGASSDYSALLQVLEQLAALAALRAVDPLGPARLRGLRAREWILRQEGGAFTSGQMAAALGISRQAVDKRRKRSALIGIELGRRGYSYPAWQLGAEGVLDGLESVLADLRGESAWAQAAFFLTSNVWLDGETPLAALRRGDVGRVVRAALMRGEQLAA
ncbi:MAG: hypothetical protein ACR2OO_02115 [Thermomicrobiales bacterium]